METITRVPVSPTVWRSGGKLPTTWLWLWGSGPVYLSRVTPAKEVIAFQRQSVKELQLFYLVLEFFNF